jgi:hypothetical protein
VHPVYNNVEKVDENDSGLKPLEPPFFSVLRFGPLSTIGLLPESEATVYHRSRSNSPLVGVRVFETTPARHRRRNALRDPLNGGVEVHSAAFVDICKELCCEIAPLLPLLLVVSTCTIIKCTNDAA